MARFKIICETCGFEDVKDDAEVPDHVPEWADWDAESAATGARDGHAASYGHSDVRVEQVDSSADRD